MNWLPLLLLLTAPTLAFAEADAAPTKVICTALCYSGNWTVQINPVIAKGKTEDEAKKELARVCANFSEGAVQGFRIHLGKVKGYLHSRHVNLNNPTDIDPMSDRVSCIEL